jgi:hypothetical protein
VSYVLQKDSGNDYLMQRLHEKPWMFHQAKTLKLSPFIQMYLRSLKKNDSIHSNHVEMYLNRIIVTSRIEIDVVSSFILIYASVLHDVGYRQSAHNHHSESADMVIEHADKFLIGDDNLAKAISDIIRVHGDADIGLLHKLPEYYPISSIDLMQPVNLKFLAALFKLSDDLDNTYARLLGLPDDQFRSKIDHIDVGPQIIRIESSDPSAKETTKEYLQKSIKVLKPILQNQGIQIEEVL